MSLRGLVVGLAVLAVLVGGCARPPQERLLEQATAYQSIDSGLTTSGIRPLAEPKSESASRIAMPAFTSAERHAFPAIPLAGRTLAVASAAEIVLRPGEVVLTFDDGPRPGRTEAILATLDRFAVPATFMMLGSAAEAHPALAREVAARGHTIGTHTYGHHDLGVMSNAEAMAEIERGEAAVARALGRAPANFFRFPYLAETGLLRTSLVADNRVILDVHIDSKDYYAETPAAVLRRTLDRLEARGSGIVLFHDIHQRTVAMLPEFLDALSARGYSVVRLVPRTPLDRDLVIAGETGAPGA